MIKKITILFFLLVASIPLEAQEIGGQDMCPKEQQLTQKLKTGSINGVYHPYTGSIVTEAHILQEHLNRLGFGPIKVDGHLGKNSTASIKSLQRKLGLRKIDAIVGANTIQAINNSCQTLIPNTDLDKKNLIKELQDQIRELTLRLAQKKSVKNKKNSNPEISMETYVIDLERWDISNTRTHPIKTTQQLQSAINWAADQGAYTNIKIPAGHYLIGKHGNDIYQQGIELPSNISLILDQEAILEMNTNDKWNYCALAIRNAVNISISGGTIIGDRETHIYTPRKHDKKNDHDEGHLICIENTSQNISVENMTLTGANGDGILLVGSPKGHPQELKNITIRNNIFDNNRRQGISIVGAKDVIIENNVIRHTHGTAPQFGVDIEGAGRINENITIRSNHFHHNAGGDIVNTDGKNILVENNILEQGENSRYIDGPLVYHKNADWRVRNNTITMLTPSVNNWNGIIMYSSDKPKTNPATSYIINNTCNNCGFYMYKGADLVIQNNKLHKGHLAFKEMKNLTLENNHVNHPQQCWAYRFLDVSGSASGNTYNTTPFPIPLSQHKSWNGCWIK